jgi:hypothetical protein
MREVLTSVVDRSEWLASSFGGLNLGQESEASSG